MATTTLTYLQQGLHSLMMLESFSLFCIYLMLIPLALVWRRITSPLQLRPILVVHNFGCSLLSLYCFLGFSYGLYQSGSLFKKGPSEHLKLYFWMYYITKILELMDTVFMILRHKQRQITFLHIYHHGSMLLLSDLAIHFYPWPAIAPYLGLNSLVHIVLYCYYGLTALFPENPPQWKQRLTEFQILQFCIDFIHVIYGYLYHGFCIYGLLYGISMTYLFTNFYYHAYIKRKASKDISKQE
ncbi:hypothetical protein CHS0354_028350 [Potamilus streckersoni]|uniref:Elongation of very long chain fatty acids protein n=1 Tax=Potamilus streckersoni TaxID=2493646 RepID=A0AAE0RTV7_9BIVA|nr:hypothetical protein CHS0354_028350 [Potamilus streckersoni]